MFCKSALKDELVPTPRHKGGKVDVGKRNRMIAQAFGRLGIALKAKFQAEADEWNAREAAEEKALYESEEDYLRAVYVSTLL